VPTYKQRPIPKKEAENLPFYRPIDNLAFQAVENRKKIIPLLVLAVLGLALFGGFKAYSAHYENKASQLLDRGENEVLAKEFGRSRAARVARLKLGKLALDTKEYDRAIGWYAPVVDDKGAPALLRVTAQQNLALAYFKKGDSAKAIELLNKTARDPENSSDDYTQLLVAYVQEAGGHKDQALGIYKRLEPETQSTSLPPSH
jgi:hypothetical protein